MYEFQSVDWFTITGRGEAASIREKWSESGDRYSPQVLTNETVKIDGKEYVVKGVEMFMIMCNREQPYRTHFALLVDKR